MHDSLASTHLMFFRVEGSTYTMCVSPECASVLPMCNNLTGKIVLIPLFYSCMHTAHISTTLHVLPFLSVCSAHITVHTYGQRKVLMD